MATSGSKRILINAVSVLLHSRRVIHHGNIGINNSGVVGGMAVLPELRVTSNEDLARLAMRGGRTQKLKFRDKLHCSNIFLMITGNPLLLVSVSNCHTGINICIYIFCSISYK